MKAMLCTSARRWFRCHLKEDVAADRFAARKRRAYLGRL